MTTAFWSPVPTEQINPNTVEIDLVSTEAMLTQINDADQQVAIAVRAAIPQIATVVDRTVRAFETGGRLIYLGAGTSGRLGVLDASECPPTFGVEPGLVIGVIAGGDTALRNAVEGAEDNAALGTQAIADLNVSPADVVVGLSASGGAAWVVAAMEAAKIQGAFTAAITCYQDSKLAQVVDVAMVADVGPEVLTGSTRLKAGTAQKLILNMISTGAMIGWGKTYRNLMVDLKPSNIKLKDRAQRLVAHLANCTPEEATKALEQTHGKVKPAVVMCTLGVSATQAQELLTQAHGKLRMVLENNT